MPSRPGGSACPPIVPSTRSWPTIWRISGPDAAERPGGKFPGRPFRREGAVFRPTTTPSVLSEPGGVGGGHGPSVYRAEGPRPSWGPAGVRRGLAGGVRSAGGSGWENGIGPGRGPGPDAVPTTRWRRAPEGGGHAGPRPKAVMALSAPVRPWRTPRSRWRTSSPWRSRTARTYGHRSTVERGGGTLLSRPRGLSLLATGRPTTPRLLGWVWTERMRL